ncbi:hypothetical protein BsWGS_14940 [Bradybaena similaris]
MVSEVVIAFGLLPAVLFIMVMALVLISDALHFGIDFCSKNQCGPWAYFFLQLLSTIIQAVALPVYLMLIIIELVLNFIQTLLQTLSTGVVLLLGFPLGLFALLMALGGCLYYDTLLSMPVPMPEEEGG